MYDDAKLTPEETKQAKEFLSQLDQAKSNLKEFAQEPTANILGNEQELDLIKYNLLIAIQATIDTCYHFVAKTDTLAPKDYAYCFELSARLGIIDNGLVADLEDIAHFRNVLIAGNANNELICDVLKNKLTSLDNFEKEIICFIENCRPFNI